jgi:23S rRNA (adenine2503-C2)-methyltransferase
MLDKKFPASRNRLTVVYVMRQDNISADDAGRLKKLFRHNRIRVNLIPLNDGSHEYSPPSEEQIGRFVKDLEIMNVPITVRKSFGSDIFGACGQLSGKKYADADGCTIQELR